MSDFSESLSLPGGLYLEASEERFRLHRLPPWQASPADALSAQGLARSTRQLMSGAMYAGFSAAATTATGARPSSAERDVFLRYVHGLAAGWRTTGVTPGAMRRAADRLEERGQHAVAAHCRHVAEEETGHDTLAWLDMEALGLPAATFVERLRPRTAIALAERHRELAEAAEPIAVLGYAYVLERTSLNVTAEVIAEVEAALPAGVFATRCLRVHSAVGSDIGHVDESLEFIAGLDARDRAIIAREAFNTARVMGGGDDYPGDDAMRDMLAELMQPTPALACA
ncbi:MULTISPECIES: hypothetical protein [Nitrospirillum]|uniref:Heme oxygenase-like protein n=1 Tax=Nitrospirillum amazonense TaxID=28077 RepID=A0A560G324_9PROT|nr:hypothetical protein [Nitrospirillum amazonense]MEC4593968.1 hypothetical protein [Nitrospirillum amazonense]TWB28296.1 hypothetical protein FBZ88_10515 [Nitrospirillum amazonense]